MHLPSPILANVAPPGREDISGVSSPVSAVSEWVLLGDGWASISHYYVNTLHYELHSHRCDNSRDYLSWLCLQPRDCFYLGCLWLCKELTWCQLGGPHSGGLHLPTWDLCQPSQKILVHAIPLLPFQRRDLLSSQPGLVLLRDFQLKISLGLLYPGGKGKAAKTTRGQSSFQPLPCSSASPPPLPGTFNSTL